MHSVSMPHTGRIQSFSIMINGTRTIHYFITSVTVHIAYTKIMVTLLGIVFTPRIIAVEHPVLFQVLAIPIECRQHSAGIISAAHHHTGMYSIQISHTSQETVTAVGTIVSPVGQLTTSRNIINCFHRFSCQSVEYGQVFVTSQDTSLVTRCIPVGISVCDTRFTVISLGITYYLSFSILCSIRSLHDYFCFTISIQIKHHKLGIVCSGADIMPQVNTP